MHLTRIALTDFRAFSRLELDLPGRLLVLVGDNAQGKTTLLEAIYYLATFTSLQADSDRQLINFTAAEQNQAVARLVADFSKAGQSHRLEVRLIQENGGNGGSRLRKQILLDGVTRPAHEVVGFFSAVIFLPQMTRIIDGAPDERRRYLNLALSQAVPGYAKTLAEYTQVVTQRNALLKQLGERGGDSDQLTYWDELLADRGAFLILHRIRAIQELERLSARIHVRLTHSVEVLRLLYQPSYDPKPSTEGQYTLNLRSTAQHSTLTFAEIQQGFLQRLRQLRAEEIQRGMTVCGPHRDELRFLSNGVDLGDYGSRGQVRTTMLSLKLAELMWIKDRTGEWPVLLLDEIMAELDLQRRADLQTYLLENEHQALLTTTDNHLFSPEFNETCTLWHVHQGQVSFS
jgi:DNA replication and repair protein RecF